MAAEAAAAEVRSEEVIAATAGKDGDAAVTCANDENVVSVGSKEHGVLKEGQPVCTPCAWFHKPSGCLNAKECYYCHLCPPEELKNRKKLKVQRMKSKDLEAKGDLSTLIKRGRTGPVGDSEEKSDANLRRANTMPSSTGDDSPDDNADGADGKRDGKLLLPGVGGALDLTVSEGSKVHGTLDANGAPACHPCAWFHKSSCKNDKECIFCHLCPPGELKNRKKAKIAKLRGMDGATPTPTSPSPAGLSGKRSDKRPQRTGPDPGSLRGSPVGMWPSTPFGNAGMVPQAEFMSPAYGYGGMYGPSPWPYMDPATFGYDPRLIIGMPPPSPAGLPPDMPMNMPPPSPAGLPPDLSAMMAMSPAMSMMEPKSVVPGPLQDNPPGLSLPAEVPEGKITKINWSVDIRNLGSSKKASSPAFQVPGASGNFRMALLPKGGASFVDAAMRGTVQVVREEISPMLPGVVSMQVTVSRMGDDAHAENQETQRWPLKHDFALSHVFALPKGMDEFDLEAIGGESRAVNICLEILPPGVAT